MSGEQPAAVDRDALVQAFVAELRRVEAFVGVDEIDEGNEPLFFLRSYYVRGSADGWTPARFAKRVTDVVIVELRRQGVIS